MSDLFPKLATCVDDMAFIYSMHSKTALHGPACFMMNTGFTLPGFPSMGSWVTYGLGSEADDLPAFVVLPNIRPPRWTHRIRSNPLPICFPLQSSRDKVRMLTAINFSSYSN